MNKFIWYGKNKHLNTIDQSQAMTTNDLLFGYYPSWFSLENRKPHNNFEFLAECFFTGFKDYDNKEIFEGDIISFTAVRDSTQKKILEIYFDKDCGAWYCKNGQELCNILFEQNNDDWKRSQNWTVRDCQYVRVIGNIHENPELLNN
jgi:hypothetical protein